MTNSESLSLLWNLISAAQVKKSMYVTDKHACSRHTVVHWETIILNFFKMYTLYCSDFKQCWVLICLAFHSMSLKRVATIMMCVFFWKHSPNSMYIVSRNVLHKTLAPWVITGESKCQLAAASAWQLRPPVNSTRTADDRLCNLMVGFLS